MKVPAVSYQQAQPKAFRYRFIPAKHPELWFREPQAHSHMNTNQTAYPFEGGCDMKIHVKMSEADYLLFQKYKENAGKLRLELGSDLVQLRQEHDRLCLALLQGIEPDDSGCTIVNDSLVSRAVEMAMRWRQQQ